jgi:hypothetical protein
MRRPSLSLLVAVALLAPAAAAESPAETKFREAMERMKARAFDEACSLFEESERLAPAMTTEFRLAECYEQIGKLASAHRLYGEAAAAAERESMPERRDFARARVEAVAPRLLRLAIEPSAAAATIAGLAIERDGKPLPAAEWGVAVPVDPGDHQVRATAPGRRAWSTVLRLEGTGREERVSVPDLVAAAPAVAEEDDGGGIGPIAVAGLVVGGIGLAAMGAGVGMGFAAKSKYDDSLAECADGAHCTAAGLDQQDEALALGTAGTAVFVIGAVAFAAGGGMLIYELASDEEEGVAVRLGPGGAAFRCRF